MERESAAATPPRKGTRRGDPSAMREAAPPYEAQADAGERLLAWLGRAQAAVAAAQSLGEALEAILDCTLEGLGWEAGVLCLLGTAEGKTPDVLRRLRASAADEMRAYAGAAFAAGRPAGSPVIVNPDDVPASLREGFSQVALVPVFLGGARPEAVLAVATEADTPPARADIRFLEAIASLLAWALDYDALRASSEQMRMEMEALHQVSLFVSEHSDMSKLLKSALMAVERALRVSACAVYEADERGRGLRCVARRNVPEEVVRAVEANAPSTPAHRALKTGAPVVITRAGEYTGSPQVVEAALQASIQSAMIVPIFVGGKGFGVLSLYDTAPREWSDSDRRLAQMLAGSLGSALSQAQSYRKLAESVARLRDLHRISLRLMELPAADAVAILAADAGRELFRADAVAIHEHVRRYGLLKLLSAAPAVAEHFPLAVPAGRGVWGKAASEQKPVARSLRLARVGFYGFAAAVPLRTQDELIGVFTALRSAEKGAFGEDDLELLGLFANLVAAAIQKARLLSRSEELGILKERNRVATEMHDSVGGDLAGILVKAQLARTFLDSDLARAAAEMDWIIAALQRSITQLRRVLHALKPVELEEQGFLPALRRLLETQADQYGIAVTLDATEPFPRLGPRVEGLLYRAVSECLNNIRKHAATASARVSLQAEANRVVLVVEDDGKGFDPDAAALSRGMGLRTLRESVQAAGGDMSIASAPGEGARITVSLPF